MMPSPRVVYRLVFYRMACAMDRWRLDRVLERHAPVKRTVVGRDVSCCTSCDRAPAGFKAWIVWPCKPRLDALEELSKLPPPGYPRMVFDRARPQVDVLLAGGEVDDTFVRGETLADLWERKSFGVNAHGRVVRVRISLDEPGDPLERALAFKKMYEAQ